MTEKERMLNGELYISSDKELVLERKLAKQFMDEFNFEEKDIQKRMDLVKKQFKKVGSNCYITAPLYIDYGSNITVGDNFYANFDCIFLDVNEIIISDNVMFGPRVSLFTATHPIDKDVRNIPLEYGVKIMIGNNVWLGGNVVVNPGVTIGDNTIVGSGSVVTKDIPSDVIAAGNPCKVIRKITDEDKLFWEKKKHEYYQK
ncbi:MAG: sugar O-acetyltransferase [Acholeplasma sp.]|nr:sugar O-acetyltransferase [Acholeplasma sp.]